MHRCPMCAGLAAPSHLPVPLMLEILGNVAVRPGNVAPYLRVSLFYSTSVGFTFLPSISRPFLLSLLL